MRAAVAFLLLAACVSPPTSENYDCNCVELPSDEQSIAKTGFPNDLIYMQRAQDAQDDSGLTYWALQFDATKATPAMIAAAPAALCKADDKALVSSRVEPPGAEDMDIEGSMIVKAMCK